MIDIKEIMQFAMKAHSGQMYGNLPYITHLSDVYRVLLEFSITEEHVLCAAWLHDVLEDTEYHYSEIVHITDEQTAEIVYCITDELGRNRKERKEKTWPKLQSNNQAIIVKQADMIANIRQGMTEKSSKLKMYTREYPKFREYFEGHGSNNLWNELDTLLEFKLEDVPEEPFFPPLHIP
jgi:(p)ppGpp synthase/HD superfamily hydrolase